MTCGVYGIFSKSDECLYVGLSRDVESRWLSHIKKLKAGKHPQERFVAWFQEHDKVQGMIFKILEDLPPETSDQDLNRCEMLWFEKLRPRFYSKYPSLNETWALSEETKSRISAGVKQRNVDLDRGPQQRLRVVCSCGIEFDSVLYRESKYCSRKCSAVYKGVVITREKLHELYWVDQLSLTSIAAILEISFQSVHKKMNSYGIPRRSRKEAANLSKA